MSTAHRQTASTAARLFRSARTPQLNRGISTSPSLFADKSSSAGNSTPSDPRTQTPPKPVTRASRLPFIGTGPKTPLPSTPYTVSQPPQFPAPNDPFYQASTPVTDAHGQPAPSVPVATGGLTPNAAGYSDTTKAVVRGVARLMGYNSRASTAIRETGRMMRGVVESIERDRVYWYEECGLPPTYQTFFQLHLLYVLILLPRLRAVAVTPTSTTHQIPEPLEPSAPTHSPTPDLAQSTLSPSSSTPTPASSSSTILGKPDHDAYPSELLNHFFELAESEMRKVLGRGERERVVKKYMAEMGEQWKGAGAGLDYVMGLDSAEPGKADVELASWVWRNLYASQGLTAGPEAQRELESKEVEMVQRLEEVVVFVRKEMARLDKVEDADVLDGIIGDWGSPKL